MGGGECIIFPANKEEVKLHKEVFINLYKKELGKPATSQFLIHDSGKICSETVPKQPHPIVPIVIRKDISFYYPPTTELGFIDALIRPGFFLQPPSDINSLRGKSVF